MHVKLKRSKKDDLSLKVNLCQVLLLQLVDRKNLLIIVPLASSQMQLAQLVMVLIWQATCALYNGILSG